jgi:hypothetical protein
MLCFNPNPCRLLHSAWRVRTVRAGRMTPNDICFLLVEILLSERLNSTEQLLVATSPWYSFFYHWVISRLEKNVSRHCWRGHHGKCTRTLLISNMLMMMMMARRISREPSPSPTRTTPTKGSSRATRSRSSHLIGPHIICPTNQIS